MNQTQRILLFIILPILAPLLLPPEWYANAGFLAFVIMLVLLSSIAGLFMLRGSSWAITLCIFMQGLNVISRLMMFWPHFTRGGSVNLLFVLASVLSIGLSAYLVLRLDKVDVRVQMVR